ncbi:MAG: hypothetical protein IRZ33_02495 [Alicyclobacillaceae bacterium]|nr:hypothetical protein [Alicyclobacillaceae bacterium]
MVSQIVVDGVLLGLAAAAYLWVSKARGRGGSSVRRFVGQGYPWQRGSGFGLASVIQRMTGGPGPQHNVVPRPPGEEHSLAPQRSEGVSGAAHEDAATDALVDEVSVVLDDICREFAAEARRVRQDAAVAIDTSRRELIQIIRALEGRVNLLEAELAAVRQELTQYAGLRPTSSSNGVSQAARTSDSRHASAGTTLLAETPPTMGENAPDSPAAVGHASDGLADGGHADILQERVPQVIERLQRGDAPLDIARHFGIGVYEVELVRQVMGPAERSPAGEGLS